MTTKSDVPEGLGDAGRRLWQSITAIYELTPSETAMLESACREADLIAKLEAALVDAPLTVKGSMGQEVAHPMITELRQHRMAQTSILKSIKLPNNDVAESAESRNGPMSRSESGRKAARARWGT